jgi:transposase
MSDNLNVRPYNNKEQFLFPPSIGDFLPEDDLVFVIDEVVDNLNLRPFYRQIPAEGNPSYHPALIVKVLFYAYARKSSSARKMAQNLEREVGFIYLAGMQKPNFRTISDFRKNHLEELKELFKEIVKTCYQLGMVRLGHISLDSKVMKANASISRNYTEERLKKEQAEIESSIKEYLKEGIKIDEEEDRQYGSNKRGDEIPEGLRRKQERLKKIKAVVEEMKRNQGPSNKDSHGKINSTDPDAKMQKDKGRVFEGYRAQVGVDDKNQVIVVAEVTNQQADTEQLIPLTDKVIEVGRELKGEINEPIKVTVDSGYSSGDNLAEIEKRPEVDLYMPDCLYESYQRGHPPGGEFDKSRFRYDEAKDEFICPEGQVLKQIKKTASDSGGITIYGGVECKSCKQFGQCTKNKRGRTIQVVSNESLIRKMREKLKTPEGKEIYSKRKTIVEPVNGNFSENLGFRGFMLRGVKKVVGEFSLICSVHNLLKIWRWLKERKKSLSEALYGVEKGGQIELAQIRT